MSRIESWLLDGWSFSCWCVFLEVHSVTARNDWRFLLEDSKRLQGDCQRRWRVSRHLPMAWRLFIDAIDRCKTVGAWNCNRGNEVCYPRYLGITRRSCLEAHMVLDMETESRSDLSMALKGPSFFFSARPVLSAVTASITTGLGLHQRGLLLHEVIGPRYHGMCHIWSL